MNSYLVERYLPGLSEADVRAGLARAQAACLEQCAAGIEIRYLGSIFLALEEACFCRFDSERAETVAEVNQRAEFAFARITPGVAIAPGVEITPDVAIAPPEATPRTSPHPSLNPGGATT